MKILKLTLLLLAIVSVQNATAQYFEPENTAWSGTFGVGMASYNGDLVENKAFFRQPSYSFSAGLKYRYNSHFDARMELSFSKLQASDSKNKRADLKARNLSFESKVWDFALAIDYNLIPLTENRKFSPYLFGGVGLTHFNPTTIDRNGGKVYLRRQGTEGQGLSAFPGRDRYSLTAIQLPFGAGVKFAVTNQMMLQLEFKYRYLDTDYLDDVSGAPNGAYPARSILAAANPNVIPLTYRGDELPGGASYAASGARRGNPDNRDSYYSGMIKVAYRIK